MMRIATGLLTVVLMIAACGGDDQSEPDGASGLTDEESALVEELEDLITDDQELRADGLEQAANRASDAAEAAVPFDTAPCDLVTAEEIESVTGFAVEQVGDEPPIVCRFDLVADSDLYIVTTVDDAQGRLGGPAAVFLRHQDEGAESPFEPIEGVGEAALYAGRGLSVDAGDGRFFFIGVGGQYLDLEEPVDHLIALAELVLARL